MTFKEFMIGFMQFPGTVMSGITTFLFGSHVRDDDGDYVPHEVRFYDGRKEHTADYYEDFPGLFGYLAIATRAIGNFIYNHKTEISVAFWTSLTLAAAAVLTGIFWPAGLALVVNFPVFGLTIAGLVGTSMVAQVAAVGGLVAVASSALVYVSAAIVNSTIALVNWISSMVADNKNAGNGNNGQGNGNESNAENINEDDSEAKVGFEDDFEEVKHFGAVFAKNAEDEANLPVYQGAQSHAAAP